MESQLGLNLIEQSFNVRYSLWVREALDELPDSFTITDPSIAGHPIVFASKGFLKMSGYSVEEIIGKNGRMFQGPKTNRRSVMEIREAIREERAMQISILNYRKDGTPFSMLFHVCPVFGKEDGRVTHFVGVHVLILKKKRRFSSGFRRDGGCLCEDDSGFRETLFGSCRREVCTDSAVEFDRISAMDLVLESDVREVEIDEHCEASDAEKRKATTAISNILSVLSHYSELTGRLVCGKRCCSSETGLLVSSLNVPLGRIKQSFVLTNPQVPGMPIVYASDAFLKLTGYSRHEVLGRSCRFLSGVDTDLSTVLQIKDCIRNEQPCTVCILNYRKDNSPFWNFLHISPVRSASGKIAYYVEVQMDKCSQNKDEHGLSPEIRRHSVVGAVKVAVRSLSMASTSRS
uniref:Putative LOV domain-containing protein n=1 Tax=Maesa lanceolata TaxID=992730 RepID=A0A126X2U6_MAELA|nr:putative LOV domain-containing protein [Maesa lanceolata]